MAIIVLEPKESFEHYHSDASITFHIEGDVEVLMGEKSLPLKSGGSINVPSKTKHTIINIGESEAKVGCVGSTGQPHGQG
ncbi:cupin domain-containing protein [uncultured Marinobacter sp.]|uniref:cupin domain-containing protein n=1 Tax=uncultured Marinobacter sp. TaxID=187379 RepID=UPI0030DA4CE2|tara:strand:- start:537 stop:776 length:240 start_codon:yes stop_codon:yes gene_type:complete